MRSETSGKLPALSGRQISMPPGIDEVARIPSVSTQSVSSAQFSDQNTCAHARAHSHTHTHTPGYHVHQFAVKNETEPLKYITSFIMFELRFRKLDIGSIDWFVVEHLPGVLGLNERKSNRTKPKEMTVDGLLGCNVNQMKPNQTEPNYIISSRFLCVRIRLRYLTFLFFATNGTSMTIITIMVCVA